MGFDLILVIMNLIKISKEWNWLPVQIETDLIRNLMSDVKKSDNVKDLLYFHLWIELSIAHLPPPTYFFSAPIEPPPKPGVSVW